MSTALRRLGDAIAAKNVNERRSLAAGVQSMLTTAGNDIELASYEPNAIRSPSSWLSNRRLIVDETRHLCASALIVADQESLPDEAVRSSLEALAAQLEHPTAARDERRAAPESIPRDPFLTLVEEHLQKLQALVASERSDIPAAEHARS